MSMYMLMCRMNECVCVGVCIWSGVGESLNVFLNKSICIYYVYVSIYV